MATRRTKSEKGAPPHPQLGGDWTSSKLKILGDYLAAYTVALSRQKFRLRYVDAFAGTGYRDARKREDRKAQAQLFPDLAAPEPQELLAGSALQALRTEPAFHHFTFIERSAERCKALSELVSRFPQIEDRVSVVKGDANVEIQRLCKEFRPGERAVVFLDPFGMNVEWATIEALARTHVVDLWLLFPLGIGVNRLLARSGKIPPGWRRRLDLLLGTKDWEQAFYRAQAESGLFEDEERLVKAKIEVISEYFLNRLRSVFIAVSPHPRTLMNSANCPLYLLCFAASNKNGANLALKIANDLLLRMD